MSSILQTELITNKKSMVLYDLISDFPSVGSELYIFYIPSSNTSYKWNMETEEYDILSSVSTDLVFYDDLSSFPVTGDSISLYVANDTKYIYSWNTDTDIDMYIYEKTITTEALMLIEGTYVVYSSPSTNPPQISLNKVYRILNDNGNAYIYGDNGSKLYLNINLIMQYFKPVYGIWEDILGSAIIPEPVDYSLVEGTNEKAILNSLKLLYDTNQDGIVDRAKTADALGKYSPSYYLDANNFTNMPTETRDARVGVNGQVYSNLKERLDNEQNSIGMELELKADKTQVNTISNKLNNLQNEVVTKGVKIGNFVIERNVDFNSLDFKLIT